MKLRIIAALGLALLVTTLGWGWHSTYQNLQAASKAQKLAEARAAQLDAVLETERKRREALDMARTQYLDELEARNNEIATLRDDLNSHSRRLRIRATCPDVSEAGTDSAGAETGAAELDTAARQAYLDLRAGINKVESLLSLCRAELTARATQ